MAKLPKYDAYTVTGEGKDAVWTRIGAAWHSADTDTINVVLNALPLPNLKSEVAKVVLRPYKPKEPETSSA